MTGGRCHGPNCTRDATNGPWCAPACKAAWHDQFHWLYGDGRVQEPVIVREVVEPELVVRSDADAALAAALDAARPELEQHLAAVIQAADPPPASTVTVAEVARIAESLHRIGPPEPVKLTEEQLAALRRSMPDRPGWAPNGQVGAFDGVPIEIVETVEESTPYLLQLERMRDRFAQLVAELPPGALAVGATRLNPATKTAMQVEQLNARLRAAFPDHAEEAVAEAQRRAHSSFATYAQAVESMWSHPPEFVPAGAASTQVAPKDPQVGWLAKWINRLFGRTG